MVRVHGSAGTENGWTELSSKIARKILGYMFLASLPQLDFRSRQTAFVKGCHANIGAHMYLIIGALCRERNLECNAAQLDVWKAFDHVCHAAALRAMEAMGVGAHSRALMARTWSLSKVRARLAAKTCEPVNLERTPAGGPREPAHLRHDPGMCGQTLRREVGSERLGLLAGREAMGERELCRRHFSPQRKEARSRGHDKRHHDRIGGCWSGARRKQITLVFIPPAKPGEVLHVDTEQIQWEQVLIFVGMALDLSGSSWAGVRHRLNQWGSVSEKMDTHFQVKVCEREKKFGLDGNFSVGEHLVGKRIVDVDESNEKVR